MPKKNFKETSVIPKAHLETCTKIWVTDHAVHEWNERVGPFCDTKEQITCYMYAFLSRVGRIERLKRSCLGFKCYDEHGVWSDTIYAGCAILSDDTLAIKTFFGRASLDSRLENLESLLSFMRRERPNRTSRLTLHCNRQEGIDLKQSVETLQQMQWPHFSIRAWQEVHTVLENKDHYTRFIPKFGPEELMHMQQMDQAKDLRRQQELQEFQDLFKSEELQEVI